MVLHVLSYNAHFKVKIKKKKTTKHSRSTERNVNNFAY